MKEARKIRLTVVLKSLDIDDRKENCKMLALFRANIKYLLMLVYLPTLAVFIYLNLKGHPVLPMASVAFFRSTSPLSFVSLN